jgi:hypothetical protein
MRRSARSSSANAGSGPGLAATTAAGLARRITPVQWRAVESGLAAVTGRVLALLPAERAAALADGPVTIDLDTTDVEVYGRKKRGVAYNHQGQQVGRPHVATWAETEAVLAADLGDGTDDPRATAPDLPRSALAALPAAARASGRVAMRADAGYFAGQLARAAHDAYISFAIGTACSPRSWPAYGNCQPPPDLRTLSSGSRPRTRLTSPEPQKGTRPRTRRPLPGHEHAQHQETRHTKIIYRGRSQLTTLFAESGQNARSCRR